MFKSPVFLRKFCMCLMFFMIEWFLMVSISLFNCTFAGSVVYFSMIVSEILYNFWFVYYVRNFALVGKEAIRFIYTIKVYYFCFLFRDHICIMHIENWFNICRAAITFFHIIFVIFYDIYCCLENVFELKEGNIYRYYWRRSLKKAD